MIIPKNTYKTIIENTINICTDVCLQHDGKYLLIKRTEEPCKGVYWPIGGRIWKGETAEQAARRKILEEIGISYEGILAPMGYYEDQYTENSFVANTNYCTMSICFTGNITDVNSIKLDKTSDNWGFFAELPKRFSVKKFT